MVKILKIESQDGLLNNVLIRRGMGDFVDGGNGGNKENIWSTNKKNKMILDENQMAGRLEQAKGFLTEQRDY